MSDLVEQLRKCAATPKSVFTPHWDDEARRLMTWAADTIDAAEAAIAAERQRARLLRALLREWLVADSDSTGHGYGIGDDDITKRTEAALAGESNDA